MTSFPNRRDDSPVTRFRRGFIRTPVLTLDRYILIEAKRRLLSIKQKKYNTSLPQKETSC